MMFSYVKNVGCVFLLLLSFTLFANQDNVSLSLIDNHTNTPMVNQKVSVYKVDSSGSYSWFDNGYTDDNGHLSFYLGDVSTSNAYLFKIKAFNNFSYYSEYITAAGQYQYTLGKFRIRLRDGSASTQPAFAEQNITIYEVAPSGDTKYYASAKTDVDGLLALDFDKFELGYKYKIKAKSAVDNSSQYSDAYAQNGVYEFVVGNPPLTVTLRDGASAHPITDQRVDVYQQQTDGKFDWFKRANTDSQGQIALDLPNLGSGAVYKLKTRAFNNFSSYSALITSHDPIEFVVGKISLELINGADQNPLTDTRVDIYELANDKKNWVNKVTTDQSGYARIDLNFDAGQQYILKATSPSATMAKYSQILTANGDFRFVVGNPALNVTLSHYISGQIYANQRIDAFKVNSDGSLTWYDKTTTNDQGVANFDLDDLAQGQKYRLKASLFNNVRSYSSDITSAGNIDFLVGKLPIYTKNHETQAFMPNVRLTLYTVNNDSSLSWHSSSTTDSQGLSTFDPEPILRGGRFVVKASNPFGLNKSYYGPVINTPGEVTFSLQQDTARKLDFDAPSLTIAQPLGPQVASNGFWVSGYAYDNQAVRSVDISINSGAQTIVSEQLTLSANHQWQVFVPSNLIAAQQQLNVVATAYDFALNQQSQSVSLTVVDDQQAPSIEVAAPLNNSEVNQNGFSILGAVNDDFAVQQLTITLNDSVLGTVLDQNTVSFNQNDGQWAYHIGHQLLSNSANINIVLTATDFSGNETSSILNLTTTTINPQLATLARRTTFGLTPSLLNSVNQNESFIDAQLQPNTIDDSVFESQMAEMPVTSLRELKQYQLAYMLGSKKQLREVMTWFWENHFNTYFHSHGRVEYEFAENQLFRQNALGKFEDLLMISAKSPAMLRYLNNSDNHKDAPNENYAREVLELHTLGINGGYTAQDIVELARIFTGWHIRNREFYFSESSHDTGEKQFLGNLYYDNGVTEGEMALQALANHPATALYICQKLATYFVTESPSSELVTQCQARFIATSGEISSVLQSIFSSSEFNSEQLVANKLKSPLELVTSSIRNTTADYDLTRVRRSLDSLGMPLFENPVPTGYSEFSADWLNANTVLQRLRFVNQSVWQTNTGVNPDITPLLISLGYTESNAIVPYLFELLLANQYSQTEYDMAVAILNENGNFDIYADSAPEQLTRLLATIMSLPSYQLH